MNLSLRPPASIAAAATQARNEGFALAAFAKLTTDAEWKSAKRFQRRYELRAGPEVCATLNFASAFGSLAEAEAAEGRWTFKRGGFLRPRVTVRDAATEKELGVFAATWRGEGVLDVHAGPSFQWASQGFWHARWTWADETGRELLHLSPKSVLRSTAAVELEPAALRARTTGLLAALGWYLIILSAEDSSGAMMAVLG